MDEKMDVVIVISDDDNTEEDSANGGDDSEDIEQSTEQHAELTSDQLSLQYERDLEMAIELSLQTNLAATASSSSESRKSAKRALMHNRTWCNIRQEKQNLKQRPGSATERVSTPTVDDDSDDLPDLDTNEECIYVQVYEEEINDDSDCMIVEDSYQVVSGCTGITKNKGSVPEKTVKNEYKKLAVTSTDTKHKSEKTSYTVQSDSDRGIDFEKTMESKTGKALDSSKTSSGETDSPEPSDKETDSSKNGRKKLPILSLEGRAKLANILKTVNPRNLQKSKSVEESSKGQSATGHSSKSKEKWPFTIERHFSDILSGGSPLENDTGVHLRRNSPDKIKTNWKSSNPATLSPPVLPKGSFQPITSSPGQEHPPLLQPQVTKPSLGQEHLSLLQPQVTKPSAFANYTSTKSPGSSPTPSKRLKLGRHSSTGGVSDKITKNNFQIVNMKLGKSLSFEANIPKRRVIRRPSEVVLEGWNSKCTDVRNFFKPIPSSSSTSEMPTRTLKDWQNLKPFNVEFPVNEGLEDSLSLKLSKMHIDTIGVCFEEEGPYCLRHAIKFTHDFSLKYAPTGDIIKQMLYKGIIENNQVDLIYSSYRTLKLIQQKYPGIIQIDWDTIKLVMDTVNLGLSFIQQDVVVLLRASLFLQLTVTCYEDELYNRDVVDPKGLRQSMAYRSLTSDSLSYTGGVKQLTNWIVCCLTYGEFQEVQEISSPFFRERNPDKHQPNPNPEENVILRQELRKLLPLLQRLLKIAIEINLSSSDCARTCATELMKSFVYLSLSYKKLLLQTMQSNLLQFKLVSLMLENYCDCDAFSYYEFPSSVRDVVESLFQAQPPRMMNTPPTTPQSEEEAGDGDGEHGGRYVPKVSSVAVEELAMLQYYALQSYLQCSKAKSHIPLRVRVKSAEKEFGSLSAENLKELEKLPGHVEELRGHYLQLAIDLTQDTEKYLMMMLCLKDVTVKC
ncbi:uncharacterized protein LOC110457317 [Mizuhopecten yessoensis]|uniref:Uncharacterized protein n=1 Tax=Mizuhopecten yessoensis TaxID=6573 RepID=A0A210Q912_MIZYE|nr:uncharacterized protein LOC110457317 [Mizuhopecten yessoensis]OWF45216.1 hypothetical protein KP79_PYT01594 [Mizuhopecten yessoensis]